MINNIIWDFDGTLFDTYPGTVYAFKKALGDVNIMADEEEILKCMKVSVSYTIKYFQEKYFVDDETIKRFVSYEKNLEEEKLFPFSHAKEICEEFKKRGGRNFILTHRGNSTFKLLKYYGMLDLFEEIGTKHNCFKRKPDPEGFLYFYEKYNMNKDDALAIGDRDCDILGAKGAGMKTCLYNTNGVNIKIEGGTDYTISSLEDLYSILEIKR